MACANERFFTVESVLEREDFAFALFLVEIHGLWKESPRRRAAMVAAGSCIKFIMDAVKRWRWREGRLMGIIVVVNDVLL